LMFNQNTSLFFALLFVWSVVLKLQGVAPYI